MLSNMRLATFYIVPDRVARAAKHQRRNFPMRSLSQLKAAIMLPGIVAASLLVAPVRADVVTDWNVVANDVMTAASVGNNPRTRNLARMHVAMSDAINTVQNRYTRVVVNIPAVPGASPEAAAAAAARKSSVTKIILCLQFLKPTS